MNTVERTRIAPDEELLRSDSPRYADLRTRRRQRLFNAMVDADVDVVIMGRPSEVSYATGQRQLWLAGSRPFGPAAIAVAATRRIHLMGTSTDGLPSEFDDDELFALSWNPANLVQAVMRIDGLRDAQRVATTSFRAGFDRFLATVCPNATLVDGAVILNGVRQRKDADEIACITAGCAAAEDALSVMRSHAVAGTTERDLLAVYLERISELGVPTPPTEAVVSVIDADAPSTLRRIATTRPLAEGDLVLLDVAADVAGYQGAIGTTVEVAAHGEPPVEQPQRDGLRTRAAVLLDALIEACTPGTRGAEMRATALSTGERPTAEPILQGLGMGVEPPVIAPGIGDGAELLDGMVVSVSARVDEPGSGSWFERRVVHVADPPVVLNLDQPTRPVR